jgi:hypothetical protein
MSNNKNSNLKIVEAQERDEGAEKRRKEEAGWKLAQKNGQDWYDRVINQYPEDLKDLEEGKIKPGDVLTPEDQENLGTLIDPEYPKLLDAAPIREAGSRLRYAEHEMFFNLGLAVGRRKPWQNKLRWPLWRHSQRGKRRK